MQELYRILNKKGQNMDLNFVRGFAKKNSPVASPPPPTPSTRKNRAMCHRPPVAYVEGVEGVEMVPANISYVLRSTI